MMERVVVSTKNAPDAIGPYSQAIKFGEYVFASGQIAIDPNTGELIEGDVSVQAELVLKNLGAVLEAGNSSLDRIAKITVYIIDMAEFSAVNNVFEKVFVEQPPARETVQVSGLPRGAKIEISAIGLVGA
jgi:2-iminobutanoate/2-iminopropanoate deaminase